MTDRNDTMRAESWRLYPAVESGAYRVSDHGRVQSRRKIGRRDEFVEDWRDRTQTVTPFGYLVVGLIHDDGKLRNHFIHDMVLETFVGPCPLGMQCRHLDANRKNNHLSNLVWGTAKENAADRDRHGHTVTRKGEKHPMVKLTADQVISIREQVAKGRNRRAVAKEFGVARSTINNIICGHRWKHLMEPNSKDNTDADV